MKKRFDIKDLKVSSFVTKEINSAKGGGCWGPFHDAPDDFNLTRDNNGCLLTHPCVGC